MPRARAPSRRGAGAHANARPPPPHHRYVCRDEACIERLCKVKGKGAKQKGQLIYALRCSFDKDALQADLLSALAQVESP